ncbi:MAG TPA: beta-ketoacyl synthase N-terminal-like domain-containing protein, partial [Fibrobacteria bacterium]|nr:beta-ketoacyl synthase N-terminal-like domain-containing protein [Fibrobacteria bacterium]
MQRDVVITGMGVVSPIGHTPESYFANLLAGSSGVSSIRRFDASSYSVQFAGEVKDFDATRH